MPYAPVPQVAQLQMRYIASAQLAVNDFYFYNSNGWLPQTIEDLANAAATSWQNNMRAVQASTLVLNEVYARDLSEQFGPTYIVGNISPNVGTNGGAIMPASVTIAMKFPIGVAGRGVNGRVFHVGLTETQVANNEVTAAARVALLAAYSGFIIDIETALTISHGVVASQRNNVPLNPRSFTFANTVVLSDSTIDNQRRRLPGRGA